jgi:hypothetical protein
MADPNPRYQLYDSAEKRPPERGPGYPIADIGRKEVRGTSPSIFLSEIVDRSHYHQRGNPCRDYALPDRDDLQSPVIESARVHPVPRLPDRPLSNPLSITTHVHAEHASLHLTSHG